MYVSVLFFSTEGKIFPKLKLRRTHLTQIVNVHNSHWLFFHNSIQKVNVFERSDHAHTHTHTHTHAHTANKKALFKLKLKLLFLQFKFCPEAQVIAREHFTTSLNLVSSQQLE